MPIATTLAAIYGAYSSYKNNKNSKESSQLGYDAQSAANQTNLDIAGMNIEAQMAMQAAEIEWAQELRRREELGGGNEFNDRYYFDPELGWVVENSPGSQQVSEAGRRQDFLNRTQVDAQNRERGTRLGDLQRDEFQNAQTLNNEFQSIAPVTGSQIADVQFAANGANRNALLDGLGEQQATQQLRFDNTSNGGRDIAARAMASADSAQGDLGTAMMTRLQGGEGLTADRRNNVANSYNNFRDKSVQAWNPQFSPVSTPGFTTGSFAGSNSAMSNAFSGGAPQQPYVNTDYSAYNRSTANNAADSQLYGDLFKFGLGAFGNYQDDRQAGNVSPSTPSSSTSSTAYDGWMNNNAWF